VLRLNALRKQRGLTQKQLANIADVHYVSLARLEAGRADPRLSTLRKLAKALRVSIADLVGESKPRKGVK